MVDRRTDSICSIHIALTVRILCKEHMIITCRMTFPNCTKKTQIDAQLILSIFPQHLHVSGISRPIIRRDNHMYTTIGTYYSF